MGFIENFVDIRTATREQMEYAFGLEREAIVKWLAQIKADLESFNDHWNKGAPVVFIFRFHCRRARAVHGELAKEPNKIGQ